MTTYYLLHRRDFGTESVPIGLCILYAVSCGLSDSDLINRYDILARSGGLVVKEEQEEGEEGTEDEMEASEEEGVSSEEKGILERISNYVQNRKSVSNYRLF